MSYRKYNLLILKFVFRQIKVKCTYNYYTKILQSKKLNRAIKHTITCLNMMSCNSHIPS